MHFYIKLCSLDSESQLAKSKNFFLHKKKKIRHILQILIISDMTVTEHVLQWTQVNPLLRRGHKVLNFFIINAGGCEFAILHIV